ncbi:MAG: tRNA 2-thiouridine(34) synthase MnmA [Fusobacteria bacterium]|nr:tRNA 2-thiouridine(34) synthase MnmA [Fusobacteriota bacterium]
MKKKVVGIGLSGGIDSTVAAKLLIDEGYDVFGITMRVFDSNGDETIYENSKKVCEDLGIKHYIVDYINEFKKYVIDDFIEEYKNGRTPNPCVKCNKYIKLGKLYEEAMKLGADYFATGHYAIIKNGNIYIGEDSKKDQAYFLAQINIKNIDKILFPLGNYTKDRIREIAKEKEIKLYAKGESQEICFIKDDDYKKFLIENTNGEIEKEGEIIYKNGKVLGLHKGYSFYTIGQRKGLGIAHKTPLYVIGVDIEKNQVIVGENSDLFKKNLIINKINLIQNISREDMLNLNCKVKTRSRDNFHEVIIKEYENNEIKLEFIDNVRAITPGQLAVMYDYDNKIIGSGYIM